MVFVIEGKLWILRGLLQSALPYDKNIYTTTHEASEGIFRGVHSRFAAYIKACIDEHGTTRAGLECGY
jgi:hypothetical protein